MLFTKQSINEWYKKTSSNFENKSFYKIIIDHPRPLLIEKIRNRVQQMIDMGAVLEVKNFFKLKIPKDKSITKAIGIAEIEEFIRKTINKDELVEKISIKTRQYAKRQVTWARGHMKNWKKINPNKIKTFLKKI